MGKISKNKKILLIIPVLIALCALIVCIIVNNRSEEPDLSFLNYKNAISLLVESDEVFSIYNLPDGSKDTSYTRIGNVSGKDLARYLDSVTWQKWKAPSEGLASPGSVDFCIDEEYRITVYQKPRWVKVTYLDDTRYYKAHGGDYDDAVKLFLEANSFSGVKKWFDCLHGDEMIWDGMRETSLYEFDDVTFRWTSERVEAVTKKETAPLYYGMPIWSIYLCDLTGDGKPELCSSISLGSGIVDERIIVYDYAHGASYELSDRGNFDYILNQQGDHLIVEKREYAKEELISSGELVYKDGSIQIVEME